MKWKYRKKQYVVSFGVVNLFNGNMRLYISSDLSGNLKYVLSLIAPVFVYSMIIMYCKKALKRIDKISAMEALRSDIMEGGKNRKYSFSLLSNKFFSTNIYMGIRDVWKRFKLYRLLIFIFLVSMAMSTMGVAKMQFVVILWQTWIICPLVLIGVVVFTISLCFKV
ncbi:MAG: hypothetical protein ACRC68_00085, partial [Clostridium sp.]